MDKLRTLLLLSLLIFMVGCSSFRKKGDKLLEAGNYTAALNMYAKALKHDPNDEKALMGQRKARLMFIDKSLIKVRMTRMGGDSYGSTETLRDVVIKQREWQLFPEGPVAFTQKEEMASASRFLRKEIQKTIKDQQALKASYLLKYFDPVFDEKHQRFKTQAHQNVTQIGQKRCQRLVQKASFKEKPYLSDFLRSFCLYYGSQPQSVPQNTAQQKGLYRSLEVRNQGRWPGHVAAQIEAAVREAFQSSAWYDPEGPKTLSLNFTGSYDYQERRHPIYQTHHYTEKVPIKKQNSDGYWVETGEYRSEGRVHNYTAYNEIQKVNAFISVQGQLKKQTFRWPYNFGDQYSGTTHNQYLPKIGLYPAKSKMKAESHYIEQIRKGMAKVFDDSFKTAWLQHHCQGAGSSQNFSDLGEAALRCLREEREQPALFADNWHKTHFGVDSQKARFVLGQVL